MAVLIIRSLKKIFFKMQEEKQLDTILSQNDENNKLK